MLIPPPKYKLKLANQSECDALALVCQRFTQIEPSAEDMLARYLLIKLAEHSLKGVQKFSLQLRAHEANALALMLTDFERTFYPNNMLSPYNRTFNNRIAAAIHKDQTSYYSLINP